MSLRFSALVLAALVCGICSADTGPEKGSSPKEFKAFCVTGALADKDAEIVKERGERPTIYIFVAADRFDRPIARYIKKLDDAIAAGLQSEKDADVFAIWLTDDAAKSKEYLPKAQMSLRMVRTSFAVFEGAKQGPEGWNIDTADTVTTVVVRGGKVAQSFGYKSTNDADVPDVVKVVDVK